MQGRDGAEGQNRTDDTTIFSRVLYLLSYLGAAIHSSGRRGDGLCRVPPGAGWDARPDWGKLVPSGSGSCLVVQTR